MVANQCMCYVIKAGEILPLDCPVDGKGFSRVVIRSSGTVRFSTESGVPSFRNYEVSTAPILFRFDGGDNTVPRTLYFRNATSADATVFLFIEEVGSNPVSNPATAAMFVEEDGSSPVQEEEF